MTTAGDPARELDVLAVIDHLAMGGAEMLLGQFAAAAPRAGIRVHVACFQNFDDSPSAEPLRAVGIDPVNLEVNGRPGWRHLQVLRAHMREVDPDVVHTHLGTADLIGGLAGRSLGIPVVSTIHAVVSRSRGVRGTKDAAFALGRRYCDARVIAVSESARRAYSESWGTAAKIVRIYNGVDVKALPGSGVELRRELGVDQDALLVGTISALRIEKAHDVAIEAIALLGERFPQLRLMIVGQGSRRAELERLAAPLGERVIFTGRRTDVMRVLDALDVCVHPSRSDAFPTTLIEALAASTPVLSTAVGGVPEIIEDGHTGVLVPAPPTAANVAQALGGLLEDPVRRHNLAAAGRGAYEERFTAEPWVRETRELYDTVITESRRNGRHAR